MIKFAMGRSREYLGPFLPFIIHGEPKADRDKQTGSKVPEGRKEVARNTGWKGDAENRRASRRRSKKGPEKGSLVLCGRGPYFIETRAGKQQAGARVYPPLFGPCEEACGHVSPRIPGDRIKRGRRKGSRRCM